MIDYCVFPSQVKVDELENKFVILHLLRDYVLDVEATCPEIIPDLVEAYQAYGRHGTSELEIVFLWLGDDKDVFSNDIYMPWLAVLPEDERTINVFAEEFDFPGHPVCFLLFDCNGYLCLYDAITNINAYGVRGFPFTHEHIKEVGKGAAKLRSQIIDRKLVTLPDILGDHVIFRPTGEEASKYFHCVCKAHIYHPYQSILHIFRKSAFSFPFSRNLSVCYG